MVCYSLAYTHNYSVDLNERTFNYVDESKPMVKALASINATGFQLSIAHSSMIWQSQVKFLQDLQPYLLIVYGTSNAVLKYEHGFKQSMIADLQQPTWPHCVAISPLIGSLIATLYSTSPIHSWSSSSSLDSLVVFTPLAITLCGSLGRTQSFST